MRAAICTAYGKPEVLKIQEVTKPLPKQNEMLIKIYASSVNSGDYKVRKADPWAVRLAFGFSKPRVGILGAVFAGIVEETGTSVTKFKPGDKVFGMSGMKMGCYAEYKCAKEESCTAIMPGNITYEEAASIPFGATTALHFLNKAGIKRAQSVLIYGASGSVGTAAVQIAKHFGGKVTAVCSSGNFDMVRSIGADTVMDYNIQDFTQTGETYNVVFETVGKVAFSKCIKAVNNNGVLIMGSGGVGDTISGVWKNITGKVKVLNGLAGEKAEDMNYIKNLVENGELKPVVDRVYPLEEIAEAHRYVELGHKRGNVVIKI